MQFNLTESTDSIYKPGQVWKYETRDGEESSELIILKVDHTEKLGNIVHVFINGLKVKSPVAPEGHSDKIMHMPFDEKIFADCVTQKVKDNEPLPDYEEGYNQWREAFEKGQGGIFTLSIKDAIQTIEEALNA